MNNQELRIEVLLEEVVRKRASDLHLQVGLPPMLRVDGSLLPVAGFNPLDEQQVEALVFAILDQDQQQILMKDKEFDFSFAFGTLGRFRVNAFHERGNLAAALRLIPNEIKSVTELGMPPVVMGFADFPRGLVLVTGPTGSGKSTTLRHSLIRSTLNARITLLPSKIRSNLRTNLKNLLLYNEKFTMTLTASRQHFAQAFVKILTLSLLVRCVTLRLFRRLLLSLRLVTWCLRHFTPIQLLSRSTV